MENKNLSTRTVTTIIFLLMVGVILFSVFALSQQSLRLDEAQSLWQVSHYPGTILYIIAQDVHVPVYEMLLYTWQQFLGNGVGASRTLSLIFFIASIPVLYLFGKLVYNSKIAIFAATIFAISPFMNWFGNEIRMYSLLVFITLLNQYFFVKIFKEKSSLAWFGYGLTAVIGVYVHYFFFLTLITQAMFYFSHRHIFPRQSLKRFIIVAVLVAVAISPWLIYVRTLGEASNTQPTLAQPTTVDFFNTFSQFIIGFQADPINTVFVSFWPLIVLLIFLALRKSTIVNESTVYMIFSFIAPSILLFLISLFWQPAFLSRYLIFTAPALYLLLSWLFATYPKPLAVFC
ncbi:TPA: hypothetical protein DCQ44_02140, partial [Candidatus Taylorbacteria bacterium]|nr:hypothetical protein [Candidatus Taylorbacteria bacterium]